MGVRRIFSRVFNNSEITFYLLETKRKTFRTKTLIVTYQNVKSRRGESPPTHPPTPMCTMHLSLAVYLCQTQSNPVRDCVGSNTRVKEFPTIVQLHSVRTMTLRQLDVNKIQGTSLSFTTRSAPSL